MLEVIVIFGDTLGGADIWLKDNDFNQPEDLLETYVILAGCWDRFIFLWVTSKTQHSKEEKNLEKD